MKLTTELPKFRQPTPTSDTPFGQIKTYGQELRTRLLNMERGLRRATRLHARLADIEGITDQRSKNASDCARDRFV